MVKMLFQRGLLPAHQKKVGVQKTAVLFAASAELHEVSSRPCLEVKEAKQGSRYMSKREQAKSGQKPRVRKHLRM